MGLSCAGLLLLPLSSVMPLSPPEEFVPAISVPSFMDSSIVEFDHNPDGADVVGESLVLNRDLCVGATRGTGADFLDGAELLYECWSCGAFVP